MKKLILILIVSIIFAKKIQAQAGVTDTLAYLQNIVANKSQYIGQPFQNLVQNLQIQIKFFQPYAAIPYNKNKETSTSFSFYFPLNSSELYLTFPKLEIYWQTPLDIMLSDNIRKANNNKGMWNSSANLLYSSAIITDIKIREQ
ncbi:MAG: hypothetical protein K2Y12_10050 [Chitinophagaceae bacterium]|nr:hypothetical protein [Chitinophagaceae bacterium]